MAALLAAIRDWNLFLAFTIADGCTEGKGREPLRWFFEQVAGKVNSQFCVIDILQCWAEPGRVRAVTA